MLFLLFQLGKDRYALEASRVVEVLPLVTLKQFPQAVKGFAGIFNYRGRPVPTIDLCELTSGQRASERLSTRIIIVNYPNGSGVSHLLGLIAEHATELLRKGTKDFVASGVKMGMAPYLGPILMDGNGPIQWVHEERLLPENVRDLLFSQTEQLSYETG